MNFTSQAPQPSLAWQFENSNVDSVTGLSPSSQVSPGPAQLQGSAALVTTVAGVSNTAVYFPGTPGSYMDLGTSGPTNINQNTSNIFVEAWVYFNSTAVGNRIFVRTPGPTSDAGTVDIVLRTSGTTLYFNYGTGGIAGGASKTGLSTGQWYHVAMSSVPGGTSYVFIGGAPGTGYSPALDTYNSGYKTLIGAGGSDYSNMYIRDLRVVQGGVVPTATFTPGAAPFSYALPDYVTGSGSTVFTLLGQFITYVPGKYGSAVSIQNFVGAASGNKQISYPVSFDMQNLTISLWTNLRTISGTDLEYLVFLSSSPNPGYLYLSVNSTNGRISCVARGDDGGTTYSAATTSNYIVSNTWYNIAAVLYNGTSILLYINGKLIDTELYSSSQTLTILNIGASGNRGMDGLIDDLRIYNAALSAEQVNSIYRSSGIPGRGIQQISTYTPPSVASLFGTTFSPINVRTPAPDTSVAGQTTFTSAAANYSDQGSIALTPLTTGLTVTVKFKLNSYSTNGGVFCLVNNITTNYYQLYLSGTSGSQKASVEMTTDSTSIGAQTSGIINTGTIYTLTIVMQNNGYIYLYLDGTLYYSSTTPVTLVNRSYNIYIARERYTTMQASLTVYDFRVINETLSSDKVLQLYKASTYNILTPRISATGTPLFSQLSQPAISSAVGAFSLRAVNGISAKSVQVRRSTDNSTQDFWADSRGNLWTVPFTGQLLQNWLGGATGYVTTWYNQIQAGQDVSAAIAANQPIIDPVNKTMIFNGSTQSFSNTSPSGGLLAASAGTGTKYTYVARFVPNATSRSVVEHNSVGFTGSNRSCLLTYGTTYGFNGEGNDTFNNLAPMTLGTAYSAVMRVDNTLAGYTANGNKNITLRSNGTDYSGATGNYATLFLNNYWFTIGRKASNNSEFFQGSMKNVMVFKDGLSDADTAVLDAWQQTL
jgi:hypothetical protein